MAELTFEFDPEARAMYIRVSREVVARTVEARPDRVWVDLDSSGEVVGIEIIAVDASGDLTATLRSAADAVDDASGKLGRELAVPV